jgi:ATP-dependent DNA helicase RecG
VAQAKRTLELLVEAGLAEAHGAARSRSYTLSAQIYRAKGEKLAYTRQVGFATVQHPEMVMNYVRQHGRIQRSEVMELCHLDTRQAGRLLTRMKTQGRLQQNGERRWAFYTLGHE